MKLYYQKKFFAYPLFYETIVSTLFFFSSIIKANRLAGLQSLQTVPKAGFNTARIVQSRQTNLVKSNSSAVT